jgi:preprotein translocase subunit SecD
MKSWLRLGALACMLLLSLAGCTLGAPLKTLQRDGGARITLQAACFPDQAKCDLSARLNSVMDALSRRASAAGYQDVVVRKGGDAQTIVVEAPGATDGTQLVPLFTSRGQLFLIDTSSQGLALGEDVSNSICQDHCAPGQYMALFRGEDLDQNQIRATTDVSSRQPVVDFALKDSARQRFADCTAANIGQYLTITLDGKVFESAVIQSQITGPGQISGNFSMSKAKTLAAELTSGALPLMMTLLAVEQVGSATSFPSKWIAEDWRSAHWA